MATTTQNDTSVRAWLSDTPLVMWLWSLALHGVAAAAISFSIPPTPAGGVGEAVRESGIVLVSRSEGGKAQYYSDRSDKIASKDLPSEPDATMALAPPSLLAPSFAMPRLPVAEPRLAAAPVAVARAVYSEVANTVAQDARHELVSATGGGAVGRGDQRAIETRVFGVSGRGSRFVYVFDRSSSMEGSLLAAAKRELIASLEGLSGVHQFQIVFYNQEPLVMPAFRGGGPRLVAADEPGKRLAAQFVGGISAYGSTNHVQALRAALALKPDVIFFLTDAHEPQLTLAELAEVRRLNRGTVINAVEFGVGSQAQPTAASQAGYNFLRQLANENGGQHGFVNVGGLLR